MPPGPGSTPAVPGRIGPYEILAEIGRGGMGAVYRALQHEPVRREVALKIVTVAADETLRRFEAERQSLAILSHPSIARIHDAGVASDGRPYFVMELVEGEALTSYCDARRLGVADRIRLMVQVCRAVQHAHQKGIIHRDLKPGNILVTEAAGAPLCKVIDFGIARAVDPGGADQIRTTRVGEAVGTPAYMSPEQLQGAADVDTRTDVFALGVILYELLVGALPFDPGAYAGWGALASMLTRDPPPASQRLSSLADTQVTLASLRGTDPRTLRSQLKGDLDWIVARAMEKERDRRYDTPNALAEDLERHLRLEPVAAGPPDARYRLSKFVRRNRVAVGAGVAVLGALVVGAGAATVGLVRALRAESEARAAEAERAVEAATAQRVSDFLVELFAASNPFVALGEEPSARDLLELGLERIRGDLAGEPRIQARLMQTLASAYGGLGYRDREGDLLAEAVTVLRDGVGPDPATALAIARQAYFDWGYRRETSDAQAAFAEAHAMMASLRPVGDSLWLRTFDLMVENLEHAGLSARRDSVIEAGVAAAEAALEPDDPRLARLLSEVAFEDPRWESEDPADHARPEARFRRAIEILEGAGERWEAVGERENLAMAFINAGRSEDAARTFEPVLDAYDARTDETDDRRLERADLYGIVAAALSGTDRTDEAISLYRRAIAVYDSVGRSADPGMESLFNSLSGVLDREGRHAENVTLHRDFVARLSRTLPRGHEMILAWKAGLAMALEAAGDPGAADGVYVERIADAVAFRDETGVDDGTVRDMMRWYADFALRHPEGGEVLPRVLAAAGSPPLDRALVLHQAGNALSDAGRLEDAAGAFRSALELRTEVLGPAHGDVAALVHNLARVEALSGRVDEAVAGYRRAVTIFKQAGGPLTPRAVTSLTNLGALYRRQGRLGPARETWADIRRIREAQLGPDSPWVGAVMMEQGFVELQAERTAEARALFLRAMPLLEAGGNDTRGPRGFAELGMAQVEALGGATPEALEWARRAAEDWAANPGSIREEALGRVVEGELLRELGRTGDADDAFARARGLYERAPGPDAPDRLLIWRPLEEMRARAERSAAGGGP